MAKDTEELAGLRFQVLNWIGIVAQLSSTLVNQRLAPMDLSYSQFVILNHMTFRGEDGLTVTDIARAIQAPQPGVTKTVQKLLDKQLLKAVPNPEDGRSKILFLTASGKRVRAKAVKDLSEMAAPPFEGIPATRLRSMLTDLDQLKIWFDDHRE